VPITVFYKVTRTIAPRSHLIDRTNLKIRCARVFLTRLTTASENSLLLLADASAQGLYTPPYSPTRGVSTWQAQNSWHCAHIRSCGWTQPTLKTEQLEFVTTISTPILWRKHSRNGASYTKAERYDLDISFLRQIWALETGNNCKYGQTPQEYKAQCRTSPSPDAVLQIMTTSVEKSC